MAKLVLGKFCQHTGPRLVGRSARRLDVLSSSSRRENVLTQQPHRLLLGHTRRLLSTEPKKPPLHEDPDDVTDLAPATTAQKVKAGFDLTLWAAGLSLAAACGYFIVRELLPTKLSPNAIFDRALDAVRGDDRVTRIVGEPLKGYGRDHGGHREGRRNFVEHANYDEPSDGSKRVRVRFNVKGPHGEAFVFAEVSNKFNGWVYLMAQDKRTGRVVVLEDNRLQLQSQTSLRSDAERNALANLLSGGGTTSR